MKKHTLTLLAGAFALACLVALPSCDKPAAGLDPLQTSAEKSPYDGSAVVTPSAAPAPEVVTPSAKPATPAAPTVPVAAAPGKTTIKPEMPKPLFVGTPLPTNYNPPNMEKPGKPVLEVQVPEGVTLLSKGKPVTSSDTAPLGELSLITDGDKGGDDGFGVELLPMKQHIQIDLGETKEIWLIWLWHYHKQGVVYKDVIVQVSDDPEFKTFTNVFNNDFDNSLGFGAGTDASWVETNHGRPMPVNGVKGRYVRFYSCGRSLDDTNQYIEAEVYGK